MDLYSLIFALCFLLLVAIPVIVGLFFFGYIDLQNQKKGKEKELQFKKDIYDEVFTIRSILEDEQSSCNEV